jgi:hypothetical protein
MPASVLLSSVLIGLLAIAGTVLQLHFSADSSDTVTGNLAYPHVPIRLSDANAAIQRFADGLKLKTVSRSNCTNHAEDEQQFLKLHEHLLKSYPVLHEKLDVETVSCFGTAYRESTLPDATPSL